MAMTLVLDGKTIRSEAAFHDAVTTASGIDWYGKNLDALWDLLIGLVEPPIQIVWTNADQSRAAFGPRFAKIVKVIEEARDELGSSQLEFVMDHGQ